jgi:cytochrome P450
VQVPDTGLSRSQVAVAFERDPLGFLLASARQHGPVVQLCPGTVMVTGRAEAMSVLRGTGQDFFLDRDFLNHELEPEQGTERDKSWLAARHTAVAEMTPDRVRGHMEWFVPRAEVFADDWLGRGVVTELRHDLEFLTADSIARFCLGAEASQQVPVTAQALLDALFPVFASPYRLPRPIRRLQPRERRVRRALADFQALLGSELTRTSGAAADGLAAAMQAAGLTGDALMGVVRSLMLAAHDVPASALSWAVAELAASQRVQEELAPVAASWDGLGVPPPEIRRFVDETLRMWPPTWGLSRITGEAAPCGQWQVPAASTVIIPLWVLHRVSPSYAVRDPDRFDPGRWTTLTPRTGEFLPFSAGPRWCPGERLARAEIAALVAVLARRTRLRLSGTVTPDVRRTLTARGFALEVSPR